MAGLFNTDGMSQPRARHPASPSAATRAKQIVSVAGAAIREERLRLTWSLRQLADRAGLSVAMVQAVESGQAGSIQTYVRLATALGLRLEMAVVDPSRKPSGSVKTVDVVHSAMGEFEAAHLRRSGFPVGLDEPYQHFQFAGRADVVAWDQRAKALLHIENRTRNPDFQAAAGSYNAKRAYLGQELAERLRIKRWESETHVIAALWSAEMLHAIRMRPESFRALCPNGTERFAGWWKGETPMPGSTSTLVVLDPLATNRERVYLGLDEALSARPRYRGYADAASRVSAG
jgi:transcriptional regulator with XRE-family HTH domain